MPAGAGRVLDLLGLAPPEPARLEHIRGMMTRQAKRVCVMLDELLDIVVERVFGLRCRVIEDPVSRTPMVIPVGRHHGAPAAVPPDPSPTVREAARGYRPNPQDTVPARMEAS